MEISYSSPALFESRLETRTRALRPSIPAIVATSPRRALLADVATLEKAAAEVFDGEEAAPMDPDALRSLPAGEWGSVRLVRAPTFRLVRVRPGAVDVLDAFVEERPLPGLAALAAGVPSAEILSGWFAEWEALGLFSGFERASGENRP